MSRVSWLPGANGDATSVFAARDSSGKFPASDLLDHGLEERRFLLERCGEFGRGVGLLYCWSRAAPRCLSSGGSAVCGPLCLPQELQPLAAGEPSDALLEDSAPFMAVLIEAGEQHARDEEVQLKCALLVALVEVLLGMRVVEPL